MSFRLTPVKNTPAERLEIASIINTAYTHDNNAYYHASFPSTTLSQRIAGTASRWGKNLTEPELWHLKLERPDTGEIMSYSRWEMPEPLVAKLAQRHGLEKPSDDELSMYQREYQDGCDNGVPKGLNKSFTDEQEVRLEKAREDWFPKCEHITLDMLMTKPEYQGKGAAAAHIKWGLELADEEKLPVFLEAGPVAKTLYLKFGFVVVGEIVHDLSLAGGKGEFVHSLMVRMVPEI